MLLVGRSRLLIFFQDEDSKKKEVKKQ